MKYTVEVIAKIHTDFPEKFGIPRQGGLVPTRGVLVFEPNYRQEEALRGIEEYSHLWLIWIFSEHVGRAYSPTVRPPRLGGNQKVGVFATRSPFRPNPVGLTSVKLVGVRKTEEWGTVLEVEGADLLDGTPIVDIKPYLPYVDSHPEALGSFAERKKDEALKVQVDESLSPDISHDEWQVIAQLLSQDPRPSYQAEGRTYGFSYKKWNIRFVVEGRVAKVTQVTLR